VEEAQKRNMVYDIITPDFTVEVPVDYEKVEAALFNLLSNAFKYTPNGGHIKVKLTDEGGNVKLVVTDNGPGIAENNIDKIFENFKRVNLNAAGPKGFGIGLYIARYFIEKHNGSISCQSTFGKGATFTIILPKITKEVLEAPLKTHRVRQEPLQEYELNPAIELTSSETKNIGQELLRESILSSQEKILIVDDNNEARAYLTKLFSSKYLVYSAADSNEGYALAKKHLPEIIISDIVMEGPLSGLELCKKIKENSGTKDIPIIMASAHPSAQNDIEKYKANDFLSKPFGMSDLTEKLNKYLEVF